MAARSWRFCVIGGFALQRWGEPRTTLDVDITLLTGWGEEAPYIDTLLEAFKSRIEGAKTFALENRILLLHSKNGKDIDVALGALPFEEAMVDRAIEVEFAPGAALRCCTAEDLFVMKCFAGRPRDLVDAESIVARQTTLDTDYILKHLGALAAAKADSDLVERAKQLLEVSR